MNEVTSHFHRGGEFIMTYYCKSSRVRIYFLYPGYDSLCLICKRIQWLKFKYTVDMHFFHTSAKSTFRLSEGAVVYLPIWLKNSKHKFSTLLFFTSLVVRGEAYMNAVSVYLDFSCQSHKFPSGKNKSSIFMTKEKIKYFTVAVGGWGAV